MAIRKRYKCPECDRWIFFRKVKSWVNARRDLGVFEEIPYPHRIEDSYNSPGERGGIFQCPAGKINYWKSKESK